jgi:hypothetical protein
MQIVTFATRGSEGVYRNYSQYLDALEAEAKRFHIPLITFSEEIFPLHPSYVPIGFQHFRKGAGYWIWKPLVILEAASISSQRYLLYMDVDLKIENINVEELIESLQDEVAAAFEMQDRLVDWCSKRAFNYFGLTSKTSCKTYASGLLLFDTQHPEFEIWIQEWRRHLLNPKLLLDPFFTWKRNHRHDQTILSALVCKGTLSVAKLPHRCLISENDGFNHLSNEATRILHGRGIPLPARRVGFLLSVLFHKLQIFQFWFRLGRHSLLKKFNFSRNNK